MKLDFGLSDANLSDESKKAWPYSFGLIYSVTLGKEGLTTTMVVRNEGDTAWDFQLLMHTYLRISVSAWLRVDYGICANMGLCRTFLPFPSLVWNPLPMSTR